MNDDQTTETGASRRAGRARSTRRRRLRAAGVGLALAGGSAVGALIAVPAVSSAQETTTTVPSPEGTAPGGTAPEGTAPADGEGCGPGAAGGRAEEQLTGDAKAKVEAAVLAAYPGATIGRAETDGDGATYEAHITTADGQRLTVLLDAEFKVTGTEQARAGGGSRPAPTEDAAGS